VRRKALSPDKHVALHPLAEDQVAEDVDYRHLGSAVTATYRVMPVERSFLDARTHAYEPKFEDSERIMVQAKSLTY